MSRLSTNLLQTVRHHAIFSPNDRVVVGVSGGADSIALIHLLASIQDRLRINLYVATLDHGLREESESDADLVERLCASLRIPVFRKRVDIRYQAKVSRVSIESAGRQKRYEFFRDVSLEVGARKVATAHHLDDQAETVLMHILRGSGLRGASGMAIVSRLPGYPGFTLVRPLLTVPKDDLRKYCVDNELEFHDDHSNQSLIWLRNRLRNQIMPMLNEAVHPKSPEALARFAEISAIDEAFMTDYTYQAIKNHYNKRSSRVYIDRSEFLSWHPAIQRRSLIHLLKSHFPHVEPGHNHILHALKVATDSSIGAIAEFPGHCHLRVDYEALILEHSDQEPDFRDDRYLLLPSPEAIPIDRLGRIDMPGMGWGLIVSLDQSGQENCLLLEVGKPALKGGLVLRGRRPGDRFSPPGLTGHSKSVKEWMIDNKIPHEIRDRIPIVVDDNGILAILWDRRWIRAFKNAKNHKEVSILGLCLFFE